MSNVARLPVQLTSHESTGLRMGPAEVLESGLAAVRLRLADGAEREASVALAFAYEPRPGDTVLAISDAEACYVIGVLAGTGKATIAFAGDLDVRAGGRLCLSGETGVEIDAPRVSLRAAALDLVARAVTERFGSLKQHVQELLSVQAGQTHTTVEGASFTSAKSSTLLTQDKVSINGKAIHLG